jgi:drug/metabolite transporter (DMT)-like permease
MLFSMLVWGFGPVVLRSLVTVLGPADSLVIRYGLVSGIYAAVLPFAGRVKIASGDWPRLLLISLVGMLGYNLGSIYGFELVPAGIGGLVIGTQPLLIVFTAALLNREAIAPAAFAGLLVALAGTVLLFWSDLALLEQAHSRLRGVLYIFLAGVFWAVYVVLAGPLILAHGAFPITALSILIATVPMLGFASSSTLHTLTVMSARAWAEMFFLVVPSTLVATTAFNYAAARLPSAAAGAFLYLVPVLAVLSGALFLGERITWRVIAGGVLILSGVAMAELADRWLIKPHRVSSP